MAETFPIYYGCKNIEDYFPKEAYQAIDIADPEGAIRIIDQLIAQDTYAKSKEILSHCKDEVLDKYNIFDYAAQICDRLNPDLAKQEVIIKPCVSIQNWHNLFNYTIRRHYYPIKKRIIYLCHKPKKLS